MLEAKADCERGIGQSSPAEVALFEPAQQARVELSEEGKYRAIRFP